MDHWAQKWRYPMVEIRMQKLTASLVCEYDVTTTKPRRSSGHSLWIKTIQTKDSVGFLRHHRYGAR